MTENGVSRWSVFGTSFTFVASRFLIASFVGAMILVVAEATLGDVDRSSTSLGFVMTRFADAVTVTVVIGIVIGLFVRIVTVTSNVVARFFFDGRLTVPRFVLATALCLPMTFAFVTATTSGARIAARDDIDVLRIVAASVMSITLAAASFILRRLHRAPTPTPWIMIIVGGLGFAVAFVATKINLDVYTRQYPWGHLGVAGLAVVGARVFGDIGVVIGRRFHSHEQPRPRGLGLVTGLAAVTGIVVIVGLRRIETAPPDARFPIGRFRVASASWMARGATPAGIVDVARLDGRWGMTRATPKHRRHLLAPRDGTAPRHVVLITIDTLRARNVSHLGYARETTPALDRLAANSVTFERAYAQAPHTMPSIMSTFVGRYPAALNFSRAQFGARERIREFTLADILGSRNFRTVGVCAFVSEQLRGPFKGLRQGFDDFALYDERPFLSAARVTEIGLAKVQAATAANQRLFLWLHYFEPHGPHGHLEPRFGRTPLDLYDAGIRAADDGLGAFLDGARDFLDDALLIVHADHGEEFREHGGRYHGGTLYEEAIHVPLVVSMRGLPARRVAAPVELVDLVPTVLDVLDVEVPEPVHGDSLVPVLLGDTPHGIAFSQIPSRGALFPELFAVVDGQEKIIAFGAGRHVALFDLKNDPLERNPNPSSLEPRRDDLTKLLQAARIVGLDVPSTSAGPPPPVAVETPVDWSDLDVVRAELKSDHPERRSLAVGAAFALGAHTFLPELRANLARGDREGVRRIAGLTVTYRATAIVPSLLERYEATDDPVLQTELLNAVVALGGANELTRLRALHRLHPVAADSPLSHRTELLAARLGDVAARRKLTKALPHLNDPTYRMTLAVLGTHADSPCRRLLRASLLAAHRSLETDAVTLAMLGRLADRTTLPLCAWLRSRPGALPVQTTDPLILTQARQIGRRPVFEEILAHITGDGTSRDRLAALKILTTWFPGQGAGRIVDDIRRRLATPPVDLPANGTWRHPPVAVKSGERPGHVALSIAWSEDVMPTPPSVGRVRDVAVVFMNDTTARTVTGHLLIDGPRTALVGSPYPDGEWRHVAVWVNENPIARGRFTDDT